VNKIIRLLLIGMVSMLSSQSSITVNSSVIGYSTLGDTVSFDKPYLWSFIKSDDSKWMASIFVEAPWSDKSVYVEELFYKPFGDIRLGKGSDKFTIGLGRQAIPFGSNIPYLDLTRGDKFTYQTFTMNDVGLLYFGDGISVYGGVGDFFIETYYGSDIENELESLSTTRFSYEWKDQFIGFSYDSEDRQSLDISGYSKYVDYVTEFREDYQWGRAIVKTGKYGLSLLAGFESDKEKTQGLYGVVWQYGEPNRFLSVELSGEGDVRVKMYYGFNLNIGKENE
jgi:hypothetical protein